MSESISYQTDSQGICELRLNRAEKLNALNAQMIHDLLHALENIQKDDAIKIVKLTAAGKHFCAGADLSDMQSMINATEQENIADSEQLAKLMHALFSLKQPTIAVAQGVTYGGGLGLLACCDVVFAASDARFCFSEVKLGLIPAVISPYVINAIGERQAKRYFLSAERFDANDAQQLGLVHESVASNQLETAAQTFVETLLANGSHAMQAVKHLCNTVRGQAFGDTLNTQTAALIAKARVSEEAQSRLKAFLKK
ncbi:MAG: gamma-carboxygeranoyl-CoA hydratase [marine bacterium B5-7]|nr:MAG: gamma-carboxygeranoyl-CoA hydratase [marine bacterium B5-7]